MLLSMANRLIPTPEKYLGCITLAAGCTVTIKPAELTPLSALALAELSRQTGFPPGVINIVPTQDPASVGKVLCSHSLVKKLSSTGSTAVGKLLLEPCADTVKKVSLELGVMPRLSSLTIQILMQLWSGRPCPDLAGGRRP